MRICRALTWASALTVLVYGEMMTVANATDTQSRIKPIALPKASQFKSETDPKILTDIGRWMSDLESSFLLNDHEMLVSGEFARDIKLKSGSVAIVKHFVFRYATSDVGRNYRIISVLQELGDNTSINKVTGQITDGCIEVDTIQTDGRGWLKRARMQPRPINKGEMKLNWGYRPIFHPFRASVTSVDQTLNGGSLDIDRHSVVKRAIKKVYTRGDLTFVWLEIGGSKATTKRIVTFKDGCPIQSDNWGRIDEKTDKIIPIDSVYTRWKKQGESNVPVKTSGSRRSRVRPGEMDFEIEWRQLGKVDEDMLALETLGTLALSLVWKRNPSIKPGRASVPIPLCVVPPEDVPALALTRARYRGGKESDPLRKMHHGHLAAISYLNTQFGATVSQGRGMSHKQSCHSIR